MGSLPPDTRCGWYGRVGAVDIPDRIDPPVPLCGYGGSDYDGCLFGTRDRHQVKEDDSHQALPVRVSARREQLSTWRRDRLLEAQQAAAAG